ncbi:tRNA (adenosine(37)-N6)-threonylcarbamoyltransferase complex ATPase subunit type 1 TsaE [Candidatus Uhrbacteria bacterium]|nr:tRNA (adenosine(37)-N6)-threonylcarbamoyltransferase complex ATPase subunit type 1 TsaE [Candidatus Uhrbacteria bacterium]MBD3284547.1 tRNA (adenosine(37)-N6)-threonylcarbamoyltransferase complex ATPase subunit type 1 TsaE [Candidatus Uhrbacteria bacterium]
MQSRSWICPKSMVMQSPMTWNISSLDGWVRVVEHVASRLTDGNILTIQGPLGAGKTTFVQALASELGAVKVPKSPTFSMLRTYELSHAQLRRLLHVDAYRIENEADLLPLDLDEELLIPGTILTMEWPERIPQWLAAHQAHALVIQPTRYGRKVSFYPA